MFFTKRSQFSQHDCQYFGKLMSPHFSQSFYHLLRKLRCVIQGPREHGVSGVSCPPWLFEIIVWKCYKSEFSELRYTFLEDFRSLTPLTFETLGVPGCRSHHILRNKCEFLNNFIFSIEMRQFLNILQSRQLIKSSRM